jgi:hypothetical protein
MNTYTVTPVRVDEIRVGDSLLVEGRPRDVGRVVEVDVPVKSFIGFDSCRRIRVYDADGDMIGEADLDSTAYLLPDGEGGVEQVPADELQALREAVARVTDNSAADDRAVALAAAALIAVLDDADAPGEPDTDTEDTEATDEDEGADDEEA